jgi:hypothetical protein
MLCYDAMRCSARRLLLVELAMAAVPLLLAAVYLPNQPATPPSPALAPAATTEPVGWREWLTRIRAALSHRPMLALATIAGVQAGVTSAWGGMVSQLITPPQYASSTAGVCGVLNGAGMLAGNGLGEYARADHTLL